MNRSVEGQFKEYFADKKLEMIRMLRGLVNVDSHTYNKTGVNQLGDTIKNKMAELRFSLKTIQQKEFGDQIVAKNLFGGKNRVLILVHLDTVLPYEKGGYSFGIENGRIALGPGVVDMKASLVQVYYVLKAFRDLKIGNRGPLTIFFNSDEEAGSPTSRKWIENEAKRSDFCLVLEPARSNGALVVERKGTGMFEMKIKGKPAHCGIDPEKGASAIEELAKKIALLQGLTDYRKGITVNVGIVKGGVARNVIAESAYAKIDVRMKFPKQINGVIHRIEEIARKRFTQGTKTELSGGLNRPPMTPTPAADRFIDIIREEGHKIGLRVSFVATGGASDGNFVSALGIPTIDGMGPIGGKLCTPDEYLLLDSLPERSTLLALVILRLWSQV
jgi:glutamate carboxypeptidase